MKTPPEGSGDHARGDARIDAREDAPAPERASDAIRHIVPPRVDDSVRSELEFHIEMRTRELVAKGMSPATARDEATARFGNLQEVSGTLRKLAHQTNDARRRTRYFSELAHDARFALRVFTRRRAFSAIAIGTLALGIGASTAIYSVVDGVLLRPLPFAEPERIAAVWITQPSLANDPVVSWLAEATPMGNEEYQALKRNVPLLRNITLWTGGYNQSLTTSAGTERVAVASVTSSVFAALQVRPAMGRAFNNADDVLNGPDVAMLGWEAWQSRFGGDTMIVGRSVTLDGVSYSVVGVMPPGFRLDRTVEAPAFWVPALRDSSDLPERHNRSYRSLARLAPGATFGAASLQAAGVLRTVTGDTTLGARVEQWQQDQGRSARGTLLMLLAAVALLLLIACVNVAILHIGEAAGRARELAARAALGAGVGRLVRQLLAESMVMALASAVLGVLLALFMLRGLILIAPERLPGMDTVSINGRVLSFTIACAVFTGVMFGSVPALLAGRASASSLVRAGGGQSGRRTRSVQQALIATQLALSMVLLVIASLLGRSLNKLTEINPGFASTGLTAVRVTMPNGVFDEPTIALTTAMMQRLKATPGIASATFASGVPFVSGGTSSPVELDLQTGVLKPVRRHTQQRSIHPSYFQMLGMRVQTGRAFTSDDGVGGELVAIVSTAEVKRDFAGQSPLNRLVKYQGKWRRVVGVVSDVKYEGLAKEDEATIYLPFNQQPNSGPVFVVRGTPAVGVEKLFKALLRELAPNAAVGRVLYVPDAIAKSYATERYRTVLTTMFGCIAALLAVVGLYGVGLRAASRRTREIGIRLAVGGTSSRVVTMLVRDAMMGVLIGLALGIPLALLAAKYVGPYLFKISPADPLSFVLVCALLAVATALASFVPARAAGRSNPAAVLRTD